MIAALVGLGGATASASNEDNIEICHRTDSNSNPYIVITTDASGQNGGTDHLHEHEGPLWTPELKKQKIEWGDVIPPPANNGLGSVAYQQFIAGGHTYEDFLAFVENDCDFEDEVPTHDVTLDKVTAGGTAPAADVDFTFTVECDSGTATSPVSISAGDDPVVVASDVAEDDLCTITETDSNGASSIGFAATPADAVDSSTADSVTVAASADVAVVATNTYPDPEPTGDVTLDKVVTGDSAPTDDPAFGFTVVCESGTVTAAPSIAASADALLVADDVTQGDECTITETDSQDADDISFEVTGGAGVTSDDDSVTFTVAAAAVSVTATNDYPEVLGAVITPVEPAQLPRTGSMTPYYLAAATALLLAGGLARMASRRIAVDREV